MGRIASAETRKLSIEARAKRVTFAKISQVLGKPMRTLMRWSKEYAETGKAAPASRVRPRPALSEQQLQLIE